MFQIRELADGLHADEMHRTPASGPIPNKFAHPSCDVSVPVHPLCGVLRGDLRIRPIYNDWHESAVSGLDRMN
jgi:hypothetical protein